MSCLFFVIVNKGGRMDAEVRFTVRIAALDDLEAVFTLAEKLATSFAVEFESFSHVFTRVVNMPDATLLVAEYEHRIVGYLLGFEHPAFYANGSVAWVEELYVESACREAGVGRLLMDCFEQSAKASGNKLVALATRRADSFYQTIGYENSATYFKKHL